LKPALTQLEESTENGKKIVKTINDEVTRWLPLESSDDVALDLEHRQKGLLWFPPPLGEGWGGGLGRV